jgi:hypothetical protein
MRSSPRTAAAAFLVLGVLSGCSGAADAPTAPAAAPLSSPVPSPSASAAPPPVSATPALPPNSVGTGPPPRTPGTPPKTPTDIVRTAGWVEGLVTRVGPGPCYGMVDWDGVAYALYSDESPQIAKGDHIRARLTPERLRIDCGTGHPMRLEAFEHVT